MTGTASPAGFGDLIETAALSWLQSKVNQALGSNVLTLGDDDGFSLGVAVSGQPALLLDGLSAVGGISGRLHIDNLAAHPLAAQLFDDFAISLTAFDISVSQGAFSSTNIAGRLQIPYFTNADGSAETVDIEITIRSNGSLAVTLAAQQADPNSMTPDGLVQLHYELPGDSAIDLLVSTLEIAEAAGVWQLALSGSFALTTAGIDWPTIDIKGLKIDSQGHISIDGGWISLPSQTAIDFAGFHVALEQLGFGTDSSGHRWAGFSGDVNLVEGIPLGGSVQGLQVDLTTGAVSFKGVGVDFSIPEVISFTGQIDHVQVTAAADLPGYGLPSTLTGDLPLDLFAGSVDVTVWAAGGLEVDAQFIVGHFTVQGVRQSVFFLAIDAELPSGLPLFPGLDLYGLSGLFASNLQPDPAAQGDTWWQWYKYPAGPQGIDTSGSPDYSATDVEKWLTPADGALAFGAGATIGTQDDGFTASAAIAFVLLLPGPVIMFVGKANILSKRIGDATEEANFDAMAVYDGNAETFDLVIDAHYGIPVVLEIEGTAELYVDLATGAWFFALGKPPHDKRVRARIFDLFEADSYFVISDSGLVTGSWVGYQNSWSFGPLSASLDAYLATEIAVQWSPLQVAGGIELHGEVHLEAFGIGLGITADALLEATAPNPFWVYGSLQLELDLAWPLPDVGGTVTLQWGPDGPAPPAPLALDTIDATLTDHGTSDRYELLAHRASWVSYVAASVPPDAYVVYDPDTPGILAATPAGYWASRPDQGPDLAPSPSGQLAWAPVVPQDSHFTLNFAHPAFDLADFQGSAETAPADIVKVGYPTDLVGSDDMSNIALTPPVIPWSIQHALMEVALYQWDGQGWQLVAATPQGSAPQDLPGVWLAQDPARSKQKSNTVLKVSPYTLRQTGAVTAAWGGTGRTLGTQFNDQGLIFDCGADVGAAAIAAPGGSLPSGLGFQPLDPAVTGLVTITFPAKVTIIAISAVSVPSGGGALPGFEVDGAALQGAATLTPDGLFVLTADAATPATTQLSMQVSEPTFLMAISYQLPAVKMPVLPQAPAFYALKAATRVAMARIGADDAAGPYQSATDGDPVIEFSYFQTACGPGTVVVPDAGQGTLGPVPSLEPPFPGLAAAANPAPGRPLAADFPFGGRLGDLKTYVQWWWPGDGDTAAYYGYDVNVEFNETYVPALYDALGGLHAARDTAPRSLHFRCTERNGNHTIFQPLAGAVPTVPQQSALVAQPLTVPYPASIAPPTAVPPVKGPGKVTGVVGLASVSTGSVSTAIGVVRGGDSATPVRQLDDGALAALGQAVALAGSQIDPRAITGAVAVDPGLAEQIIHELEEMDAALTARADWFATLQPLTRYTLDVVAGPLGGVTSDSASLPTGGVRLRAILTASDAIGALAALEDFYAYEDSLTTLATATFATSRYATFSDHLANVVAQTAPDPGVPIRRYPAAADPQAWLTANDMGRGAANEAYQLARRLLADLVARFDPLYDELYSGFPAQHPSTASGERALGAQRGVVQQDWGVLSAAISASFDALVAALGHGELASGQHVVLPPGTELGVLTSADDKTVLALLLQSPEPLSWRRLWQWAELSPVGAAPVLDRPTVLWSQDGTRAIIVPNGQPDGSYDLVLNFLGNIGAEIACITSNGASLTDIVTVGPLAMTTARLIIRGPGRPPVTG